MFDPIITRALAGDGIWAAFAVALVAYVMTASARREERLLADAARREQRLLGVLHSLSAQFARLGEKYQTLAGEMHTLKREMQVWMDAWK